MKKIGKHYFHPRNTIRSLFRRLHRAQIRKEIRRFHSLIISLGQQSDFIVDDSIADAIVLIPRRAPLTGEGTKRIGLTFLAMVHGDETAGAAVLNRLLAPFTSGALPVEIPLAFVLGNPSAAIHNVRYLHRDLNRNFGITAGNLLEEKRARELSGLLRETAFLVDFHQTTEASDKPFFIFPYQRKSLDFARAIAPEWAIVTHWDSPPEGEWFPSDGFVQRCGGVGVTVELGKKGMASAQIAEGVKCGLAAYHAVKQGFVAGTGTGPIYTWDLVPWPSGGFVDTVKGFRNFTPITKGMKLAEVDGRMVCAPSEGFILFPRYLTQRQQRSYRPTELCRILKPIQL